MAQACFQFVECYVFLLYRGQIVSSFYTPTTAVSYARLRPFIQMSPRITGLPLAVSVIEFIGSTSSFVGATFIIFCYLLLPIKRHFRHTLILNLAIFGILFYNPVTSEMAAE